MTNRAPDLLLSAALLAACAAAPQAAAAAERTMIILDASGSMWGAIDGRPKLEIARAALKQVLARIPATTELGLMAYGHREKGNCSDIEVVVPPAAGTAGRISAAADKLRFLGKTPLTEAVGRAAAALRSTEDKATVILITDGTETCGADPCALGARLEKSGVDFTAHVVGFGLTREEGRQVACLAEATGGKYMRAGNEAELKEALTKTVAAAPEKAEPERKAAPQLPKAGVATSAKPSIGQSFEATWTGPGGANDYLDIAPAGAQQAGGELAYAYLGKKRAAVLRAPGKPGAYDLRYVWEGPDKRHVLATARIEVSDSKVAIVAPATVSAGQSFEVAWKGPAQSGDYIDLTPAGHKDVAGETAYFYVDQGNPGKMKAPGDPGNYQLRYVLEAPEGRKVLATTPLEVTKASASLAFPPRAAAGGEIAVNWRGPGGAGDYIDIVPAGHSETAGELAYAYVEQSADGETVVLKLPGDAGQYAICYILEAPGGRRVLAQERLGLEAATASLKAPPATRKGGRIAVEWRGPGGAGDYIDVVPAGHSQTSGELSYRYVGETTGALAELTAPDAPGRYEIRYVLEASGGRRILARVPLEVR